MTKRFVSIWFQSLAIDWLCRQTPELALVPFATTRTQSNKIFVVEVNIWALKAGITPGLTTADAQAMCSDIQFIDHDPQLSKKLLDVIADWCFRYTPTVAVNLPDGLILDVTGCAHLWGGEKPYLKDIVTRLLSINYKVRAAIADTPGTAWAVARYAKHNPVVLPGESLSALSHLPPAALRLPEATVIVLSNLGIRTINDLIAIPRPMLSRRFGKEVVMRLDQALGDAYEYIRPKIPAPSYNARLDILETVSTAEGIALVVTRVIEDLCHQLDNDQCGIRQIKLTTYRVDGVVQHIFAGTSAPSRSPKHLFKLLKDKLGTIAPGLGIELVILSALKTESQTAAQDNLIADNSNNGANIASELIDRITNKLGKNAVICFQSHESHLPERTVNATPFEKRTPSVWLASKLRPIHLLPKPERIDVMAPVPDYPPRQFRYKGMLHRVLKADGPERIEAEWWRKEAQLRDYYRLEDDKGHRYWVFRLGMYRPMTETRWYLHGFFG